jgi:hypothetical protein
MANGLAPRYERPILTIKSGTHKVTRDRQTFHNIRTANFRCCEEADVWRRRRHFRPAQNFIANT